MKGNLFLVMAIVTLLLCAGALFTITARPNEHKTNAFVPGTIPWGPAPPFLRPGAQLAVIEGNPLGNTGDYTVRLKIANGYRIAPHWHPLRENVTVISGSFKVGMGDTFDPNKMATFPAGSFAYLDPDMHHYAMADGDAIVQVHGAAPLQFNYVNPDDDPSKGQ
jgi:quercetin dioxygenase-like cupin family protein